jgi:hypothetical protein
MNKNELIQKHQSKLHKKYKNLVEQAYNLRQTDHALSDISEYRAIKLLGKLNKLKYLSRDTYSSAI